MPALNHVKRIKPEARQQPLLDFRKGVKALLAAYDTEQMVSGVAVICDVGSTVTEFLLHVCMWRRLLRQLENEAGRSSLSSNLGACV